MLTTIDNPYNPFTQFKQWFTYDMQKGYNCCGIVDRLASTSAGLSDVENDYVIEQAIDDFISSDPLHVYVKVFETSKELPSIAWPMRQESNVTVSQ